MLKITLEAARVNRSLTQKEAAKMLGVSNKTLFNWEKGISFPPADKVSLICALYEVEYDNLNFLPKQFALSEGERKQTLKNTMY